MIEITGLGKTFGTGPKAVRALDGIDLLIEPGMFGLLGPNGAGKTTTISMLSCLLKPSGGSATVAGFDLSRQANDIKRRIGLVPQDLALYPTLSAKDNLLFYGRIYGLKGAQLKQRVDDALMQIGGGQFDRMARQRSGIERIEPARP